MISGWLARVPSGPLSSFSSPHAPIPLYPTQPPLPSSSRTTNLTAEPALTHVGDYIKWSLSKLIDENMSMSGMLFCLQEWQGFDGPGIEAPFTHLQLVDEIIMMRSMHNVLKASWVEAEAHHAPLADRTQTQQREEKR